MKSFDQIQGTLLASGFSFARTCIELEGESDVFTSPTGLSIVVNLKQCPVVSDTLVAEGISLESDGITIVLPTTEAEALQVLLWEKIDHEDQFVLSYAYGRPPGHPSPEAGEVIPAQPVTAQEPDLCP